MKLTGAKVFVTGGTGSIGSEIVRQLLPQQPAEVVVYARDEFKHYVLQEELFSFRNLRQVIGDVRDADRLRETMKGADVVIHAAAMKHVTYCEENPAEAEKTNVSGSRNVVEEARAAGVRRVIGISTDKAVSPTTKLGQTKRSMERIFMSAAAAPGGRSSFLIVRIGNVMRSRGSVVPFWKEQINRGIDIHITDKRMRRFMLEGSAVARRILHLSAAGRNGHLYVLRMPERKVYDLAHETIVQAGMEGKVKIKVIGRRHGEKLREQLLTTQERRQAVERRDYWDIAVRKEAT